MRTCLHAQFSQRVHLAPLREAGVDEVHSPNLLVLLVEVLLEYVHNASSFLSKCLTGKLEFYAPWSTKAFRLIDTNLECLNNLVVGQVPPLSLSVLCDDLRHVIL